MTEEKEIIVVSEETPSEQIAIPETPESRVTDISKMKTDERGVALLKEMYEIFSPSGAEHGMAVYVSNWLIANGITPMIDSAGNIYAQNKIRGSKRIIVNAHMDTVASKPANIQVLHTKKDVIVSSTNSQVIGADDKNGVWSVLRLLTDEEVDTPLTALLCVAEETGCNGSDYAMQHHSDYFEDCVFNITIDRRGDTDIVIENCDITLCSNEMQKQLAVWGKPFGLVTTQGSISDVSNIVEHLKINGINLFAGYHGAHTGNEYTSMRELLKSYAFQKYLLPELHKHFMLNPDSVLFEDFQRFSGYSAYDYDGYGIRSYGGQTTYIPASQKKTFSALDELDIVEKFEEVIDDIDLKSKTDSLYRELIDADYELSQSKKSLKITCGWVLVPEAMAKLEYYFTVGSNDKLDAIISLKEIEQYISTIIDDEKPKYTGVDNGGYDSEWENF